MFRPLAEIVPLGVMLARLMVSGCSSPYMIKLNDDREIIARDMSHYDEDSGFYQFTTVTGGSVQLNRNLIESITKKQGDCRVRTVTSKRDAGIKERSHPPGSSGLKDHWAVKAGQPLGITLG